MYAAIPDIEPRKAVRDGRERLNRLYRLLSQVSQVVVRARDPDRLFQALCRLAVEFGGFELAWIGRVDGADGAVTVAGSAGASPVHLDALRVAERVDETQEWPGPRALKSGHSHAMNRLQFEGAEVEDDPWRIGGFRIGSAAAVPFHRSGKIVGALHVYEAEADMFDATEMALLDEIGVDISFALEAMESRRELEDRVRERTSELLAVNRELEAFSYSVSHDLRAPLRHLTGFVELLRKGTAGRLDETCERYVHIIEETTGHMGELIDHLLRFSHLGRGDLSLTEVDTHRLVEGVIRAVSAGTGERTIEWKLGPLPVATADRALLRQVFVNLIENAVKYTRPRSPAVIEIGTAPPASGVPAEGSGGEQVWFVRDNGVGFDPRHADTVFGVFRRLHTAQEFEGVGIGLANVRKIIARHGGRTWAEGEVARGATFFFSLPRSGDRRAGNG